MLIPTANPPVPFVQINQRVQEQTGQSLSDLQRMILQECWRSSKKTYETIAKEHNYSSGYIQQRVAPGLWRLLSQAFDAKITKSNYKNVILSQLAEVETAEDTTVPAASLSASLRELPVGSLPPNSPLYIERSPEPQCYPAILQSGALVRIKGPHQMGKTSLMSRMTATAPYPTAVLTIAQADKAILSDLNRCLRWVCANLSQQLGLPPELDRFWSEDLGSKISCTLYLEGYLLPALQQPLILVLEDSGKLFDYPDVAQDFFAMVRTWHEYGKTEDIWANLRLVLIQSTESYIALDVNQSPFNIGIEIALSPFSPLQTAALAKVYDLSLSSEIIADLTTFVGGHPHLVHLALHHLALDEQSTWASLMATACTDQGIFNAHLHRHLWSLQHYPELADAFRQLLAQDRALTLPQIQAFKLNSLGLVTLDGNLAQVSCELYRAYFQARL